LLGKSLREEIVKGARPILAAVSRHLWLAKIIRSGLVALCAMVLAIQFAGLARAEDPAAAAARISDGAFAMLNGLHARGAAASNATVGAVAIFAGDAQALSGTLKAGDRGGAPSAFATLESDRSAVDSAVASNPGLFNAADWNRIKAEMAALSKQLGPAGASPHAAADTSWSTPAAIHPSAASTPVARSVGAASVPTTAATTPPDAVKASGSAPRVVIESRTADGPGVRIKGYIEGSGLKRGGIYAGAREVHPFKVDPVAGEQRINFDIGVASPEPDAVIRVYDADNRMAEAPIADETVAASPVADEASTSPPRNGSETAANAPEIPALTRSGPASAAEAPTTESGVEVFRNRRDDSGLGGANTAEIPSHGTPRRSPSKRHTMSSHLGNVQVNITMANQIELMPPTYELAGQIQGHGISHAGIYVGSRLAKSIPIKFGADVTSFDEKFVSNGGDVSIRAYGVGDQFVESSVDLSTAVASAGTPMIPDGTVLGGPMVGSASGIIVQIAAVGPITRNLYVVSGVISGRSLSSAGLYQNGMLVQRIAVGGGGIGGVLGALTGASRNVNFNVRFNPQAGPATIRAFDSSGGYSEQPVIVAGMNPYAGGMSPYGMNPYGGSPFGLNPYGYGANPYGANPYGANPYGSYGSGISPYRPNPYAGGTFGAPPVSPYLPPTNPFGSPPASSW
jgi:hypothetical protein